MTSVASSVPDVTVQQPSPAATPDSSPPNNQAGGSSDGSGRASLLLQCDGEEAVARRRRQHPLATAGCKGQLVRSTENLTSVPRAVSPRRQRSSDDCVVRGGGGEDALLTPLAWPSPDTAATDTAATAPASTAPAATVAFTSASTSATGSDRGSGSASDADWVSDSGVTFRAASGAGAAGRVSVADSGGAAAGAGASVGSGAAGHVSMCAIGSSSWSPGNSDSALAGCSPLFGNTARFSAPAAIASTPSTPFLATSPVITTSTGGEGGSRRGLLTAAASSPNIGATSSCAGSSPSNTASSTTSTTTLAASNSTSGKRSRRQPWYSMLKYSYKRRCDEFWRLFDVPGDERLLADYSCAQLGVGKMIYHGRLYVSQNYLCFVSNVIVWNKVSFCVPLRSVCALAKINVLVFPSGVSVETSDGTRYVLTSFTSRDRAFHVLESIWRHCVERRQLAPGQLWQMVHELYGSQLGLTSDDDDYVVPAAAAASCRSDQSGTAAATGGAGGGGSGGGVSDGGGWRRRRQRATAESDDVSAASAPADGGGSSSTDIMQSRDHPCHQQQEEQRRQQEGMTSGLDSCDERLATLTRSMNGIDSESFADRACDGGGGGADRTVGDHRSGAGSTVDSDDSGDAADTFAAHCDGTAHVGRQVTALELPLHVDQVFTMLFTNSDFVAVFNAERKYYDVSADDWSDLDTESAGEQQQQRPLKTRTLRFQIDVNHPLGKTSQVTERQYMCAGCRPGRRYQVDSEVTNSGVPMADVFSLVKHYCLIGGGAGGAGGGPSRAAASTRLEIWCRVHFRKSTLFRGFIERTANDGMDEHHAALNRLLTRSVAEAVPPAGGVIGAGGGGATGHGGKTKRAHKRRPHTALIGGSGSTGGGSGATEIAANKGSGASVAAGGGFIGAVSSMPRKTAASGAAGADVASGRRAAAGGGAASAWSRADRVLLLSAVVAMLLLSALNVLMYWRMARLSEAIGATAGAGDPQWRHHSSQRHTGASDSAAEWLRILERQQRLEKLELRQWRRVTAATSCLLKQTEAALLQLQHTLTQHRQQAFPSSQSPDRTSRSPSDSEVRSEPTAAAVTSSSPLQSDCLAPSHLSFSPLRSTGHIGSNTCHISQPLPTQNHFLPLCPPLLLDLPRSLPRPALHTFSLPISAPHIRGYQQRHRPAMKPCLSVAPRSQSLCVRTQRLGALLL